MTDPALKLVVVLDGKGSLSGQVRSKTRRSVVYSPPKKQTVAGTEQQD